MRPAARVAGLTKYLGWPLKWIPRQVIARNSYLHYPHYIDADLSILQEVVEAAQYLVNALALQEQGFTLPVNGGAYQDVMQTFDIRQFIQRGITNYEQLLTHQSQSP